MPAQKKEETTQDTSLKQENLPKYVYFLRHDDNAPEKLKPLTERTFPKIPNAISGEYFSIKARRMIRFGLVGYFTHDNEWVQVKPNGHFYNNTWYPGGVYSNIAAMDREVRKRLAYIKYAAREMVQEDFLNDEARSELEKALIRLFITSEVQLHFNLFISTMILLRRVGRRFRRYYDPAVAFTAIALLAYKSLHGESREKIALPFWNRYLRSEISDKRLAEIEIALYNNALERKVYIKPKAFRKEADRYNEWLKELNQKR